ncbi:lateral signaling target protein 2 homolog [Coccinella septempunctata]|uniref:lateral signaling target protein 2 homolog n=1 Tax=Coccinella septempunctata TaxID=41139 RepID=UPI001D0975B1|nr:lateral signaling target protein 2 homolog [Coccinella septempunctata]
MKVYNCHGQKKGGKCFRREFHGGPHKKNEGNDEEHLLFELFKQFLRTKLQEQRQNDDLRQEEVPPTTSAEQEAEDAEISDCCQEQNDSCPTNESKKRCHKFGSFKRGGHQKHWGKHHHWQHKKMHHHGPHHHGPHHNHRRFGCGKHREC